MTKTSSKPILWKRYLGIAFLAIISPIFFIHVPETGIEVPSFDKIVHISFHLSLSLWFLFAREKTKFVLMLMIGYGLSVELLQPLTPSRSFELLDIVANTSGVLLAVAFYRFVYPRRFN